MLKKDQDTRNFRSAILHKEKKASKCGKRILMTTRYFLKWRTTYHSFVGPLYAGGWVKFSTVGTFRMSNSRRLTTPPPPLDSQTVFLYWIWNVKGGYEIRPQSILPDVKEKARRQHSPFCSEDRTQQNCLRERSEWCNLKINMSRFRKRSHTGFGT